jgi:hypothetical protein
MDNFMKGYIICALWSTTDDSDSGECLDATYDIDDLSPEALEAIKSDCDDFQESNKKDLAEYYTKYKPVGGYDPEECAGHDFWLTRNHHGAGFWDRGLGELGQRLTKAAHVYNGQDWYGAEDGKVHIM